MQLDPELTWQVKEFANLLAPSITNFFNVSLATGCIRRSTSMHVVKPLLNNDYLDPWELKIFRHVSYLPFLSKLLKRAGSGTYDYSLCSIIRMDCVQLIRLRMLAAHIALRRRWSITVFNFLVLLCMAADGGKISVLCMFNLTALFDIVDHQLLDLF
jgi:hypothetical protein